MNNYNNGSNSDSQNASNSVSNGGNVNKKSQANFQPNKTSVSHPKQPVNGINLDYDYNTEYGDGDIPNIDK